MPLHGSSRAISSALRRGARAALVIVACLVASLARVEAAPAGQDPVAGAQTFKTKCVACHTVGGGKLVGPDLKGVTTQRDPAWLKAFIATPDKVLASGDPIAGQLLKESNNVPMPNLGLSPREVDDLIAYLAGQSAAAAPTSATAPAQPAAPAVAANGSAEQGRLLFTGRARLAGGATACIACHSVEGAAALGGGALGPDLTHVYARYGGSAGLAAALNGLPFPTMQGIYAGRPLTPDEQADLLAFFAATDQQQAASQPAQHLLAILGGGAGLAGALFVGMAFFWPRQRMSVAQRLRKNRNAL